MTTKAPKVDLSELGNAVTDLLTSQLFNLRDDLDLLDATVLAQTAVVGFLFSDSMSRLTDAERAEVDRLQAILAATYEHP